MTAEPARGRADIVYVLCLMQAAFVLLGGLGEVLLLGGAMLYLVLPAAKATLFFVLAAKVVSGRRWAIATLMVLQLITLTGFYAQLLAGLLPWFDFTVNLVGLITNVALPAGVAWLCLGLLRQGSAPSAVPAPEIDPTLEFPAVAVSR